MRGVLGGRCPLKPSQTLTSPKPNSQNPKPQTPNPKTRNPNSLSASRVRVSTAITPMGLGFGTRLSFFVGFSRAS